MPSRRLPDQSSFEDDDEQPSVLHAYRQRRAEETFSATTPFRATARAASSSPPHAAPTPSWLQTSRSVEPKYRTPGTSGLSPIPHRSYAPTPRTVMPPLPATTAMVSNSEPVKYVSPRRGLFPVTTTAPPTAELDTDYQLAADLEHHLVKQTRVGFVQHSLASKQVSLLQSQLDATQGELAAVSNADVTLRTLNYEYEERIVKLEASVAVLEARLEASARREMALLSMTKFAAAAGLPPPPPAQLPRTLSPIDQTTSSGFNHDELMRELQQLELQVHEEQAAREEAENCRVELERQMDAMHTRLEHARHESERWRDKHAVLEAEYGKLQVSSNDLEEERSRLRFRLEDELDGVLARREERLTTSKAEHVTRKLLAVLRSSVPDLDCMVALVENEVNKSPSDEGGGYIARVDNALLLAGDAASSSSASLGDDDDVDGMLRTVSTLAVRAKQARLEATEWRAMQEAAAAARPAWPRIAQPRSSSSSPPASLDVVNEESKCGVQ